MTEEKQIKKPRLSLKVLLNRIEEMELVIHKLIIQIDKLVVSDSLIQEDTEDTKKERALIESGAIRYGD